MSDNVLLMLSSISLPAVSPSQIGAMSFVVAQTLFLIKSQPREGEARFKVSCGLFERRRPIASIINYSDTPDCYLRPLVNDVLAVTHEVHVQE